MNFILKAELPKSDISNRVRENWRSDKKFGLQLLKSPVVSLREVVLEGSVNIMVIEDANGDASAGMYG